MVLVRHLFPLQNWTKLGSRHSKKAAFLQGQEKTSMRCYPNNLYSPQMNWVAYQHSSEMIRTIRNSPHIEKLDCPCSKHAPNHVMFDPPCIYVCFVLTPVLTWTLWYHWTPSHITTITRWRWSVHTYILNGWPQSKLRRRQIQTPCRLQVLKEQVLPQNFKFQFDLKVEIE